MMWKEPVTWNYPLLGPYPADVTPDYFGKAILAELTSVTEWIFFIAILILAFVLYRNRTFHDTLLNPDPRQQQKTQKFYFGLVGVTLFVVALSVIIIAVWDPFFHY